MQIQTDISNIESREVDEHAKTAPKTDEEKRVSLKKTNPEANVSRVRIELPPHHSREDGLHLGACSDYEDQYSELSRYKRACLLQKLVTAEAEEVIFEAPNRNPEATP